MATYYVDFVNGLDANNGLGPDASAGTNKPWKTVTKLLGAAGMASGDTAYLSPAGPFREVVTVAMTAATVETKIIGDFANAQGFKTSGGVLVSPGTVSLTAYTTNDKTVPSAANLFVTSSRHFLTFQNITFVAGTAGMFAAGTSHDFNFTDCVFLNLIGTAGGFLTITPSFGNAVNWVFDRCVLHMGNNSNAIVISAPTSGSGADYDVGVTFKNSLFVGGCLQWITLAQSGGLTFLPGGVVVRNNSFYGKGTAVTTAGASSTAIPCVVDNNLMLTCGSAALVANATGQIVEDYNLICTITPRTNVNAGAHSITGGTYAPLLNVGQQGNQAIRRPFLEPVAGSGILGFGNDGSQTAYDLRNNPRPAGGASASPAVGALERANTWGRETTTVRTGSNAVSITGPGYQEFDVPVAAASTTVSVYMRFDGTYTGTKPTVSVLNGSECGVTDATSSAVTTVDTWENLSLTFTPTSAGIVTIRLNSTDTNGGGKAFADDFAVA